MRESRRAFELELHGASHHLDPPDELVPVARFGRHVHRHVVGDLANAIGREKAGDQDVGVRPVELLVGDSLPARRNLEAAALLVVQDGGETLGESKWGKQSQSMAPSFPTRAAVCVPPMIP
jgi:hypothetical protein